MSDPYKILGISRDATDEEVKKAYRTLSRKYHPDANINNPNKDQAEEMFKQVQAAYQQVMYERQHPYASSDYGTGSAQQGSSSSYGNSSYGGSSYGSGGSSYDEREWGDFGDFWNMFGGAYRQQQYHQTRQDFGDDETSQHLKAAANYINSGHYQEALNVLGSISERTAQWYYFSAIANSGMGNNVIALSHAQQAAQMEPSNASYQQLVRRLQSGTGWYQQRQEPFGGNADNTGTWCLRLCLLNICLNLLCGGGGMCCC